MPKVLIINGPNLNLVGIRQPEIYGDQAMDRYIQSLRNNHPRVEVEYFQSNHEGAIIDMLQARGFDSELSGIILNAGGYTHTSVAIADAVAAIECPVVEVHISNPAAREPFRHTSLLAPVCAGTIAGFGLHSYALALQYLIGLR